MATPLSLANVVWNLVGGDLIAKVPWKDVGEAALGLQISEALDCNAATVSALNQGLATDRKPFTSKGLAFFIGAFISVEFVETKAEATTTWLEDPENVVERLLRGNDRVTDTALRSALFKECNDIAAVPNLFPDRLKKIEVQRQAMPVNTDDESAQNPRRNLIGKISSIALKCAQSVGNSAFVVGRTATNATYGKVSTA